MTNYKTSEVIQAREVLQALHQYLYDTWRINGHKPVTTKEIHEFLSSRMILASDIISIAEKGGLILQIPETDLYLPLPSKLQP